MAKISANGAREIGRVTVANDSGGHRVLVLCSDGRLLSKFVGDTGTYTLLRRGVLRPSVPVLREIAAQYGVIVD